jgi:catechol 2,3-dioxygenase-like lactoylglutathione lyase family enzyme
VKEDAVGTPTLTFQGVGHLALVTKDMEKTIRFYRDVLGMRLVGTLGNQPDGLQYRHYFLSLGPGSTLAFFEWPEVEMPARKDSGVPASGRQFDHVSLAVATGEDLLAAQQRLQDAGWNVSDVVDHGIVRSIYFEDPNDISIELSVWTVDLETDPVFEDPEPVPSARDAYESAGAS